MARVVVLDPTAAPPDVDPNPGPNAGLLAGKTVGLRLDTAWRSYEWVLNEWARRLQDSGATVVRWVAGQRVGEAGAVTTAELATFVTEVDVGIVGLGN